MSAWRTSLLLAALSLPFPAEARQHRSQAVLHAFQKASPCPSTGMTTGRCPGWIKDHIVALCDGGPDAVGNLQWQSVADAKIKDKTECHSRK